MWTDKSNIKVIDVRLILQSFKAVTSAVIWFKYLLIDWKTVLSFTYPTKFEQQCDTIHIIITDKVKSSRRKYVQWQKSISTTKKIFTTWKWIFPYFCCNMGAIEDIYFVYISIQCNHTKTNIINPSSIPVKSSDDLVLNLPLHFGILCDVPWTELI